MFRRGKRLAFTPLLVVVAVLTACALLFWLFWLRDLPGAAATARLPNSVESLKDYGRRSELRLGLQLLAAEMVAGRRSADLRAGYRMVEERMEPVMGAADGEEATALGEELDSLLLSLARQRMNAFESIGRLVRDLRSSAGPGRQSDL